MDVSSWSTISSTILLPSLDKSGTEELRNLAVTLSTCSDSKATLTKQSSNSNLGGALQELRLSGVQLGTSSRLDLTARLLTMDKL